MHQVKNNPIANRQALMPANKINALFHFHFVAFAGIIQHREAVIVTFN